MTGFIVFVLVSAARRLELSNSLQSPFVNRTFSAKSTASFAFEPSIAL
jgi:hypothetical protein